MGEAELPNSDYLPGSNDQKVTDVEIYEELIAQSGNIGATARALHLSRSRLKVRIDRNVVLTSMMMDRREEIVDQAEQNVFNDVINNDPTANRFVLGTLGKERGWAAGVAGNGKNGEIVIQINRLSEPVPE